MFVATAAKMCKHQGWQSEAVAPCIVTAWQTHTHTQPPKETVFYSWLLNQSFGNRGPQRLTQEFSDVLNLKEWECRMKNRSWMKPNRSFEARFRSHQRAASKGQTCSDFLHVSFLDNPRCSRHHEHTLPCLLCLMRIFGKSDVPWWYMMHVVLPRHCVPWDLDLLRVK